MATISICPSTDVSGIRGVCAQRFWKRSRPLKSTILEHFPDCDIEILKDDVMNCLDVLDKQNLIISALGSDGTIFETFLLQTYEHIPKIVSWFEGSVGGHAIFTRTKLDNFSEVIARNLFK